jgi:hypothetical protein
MRILAIISGEYGQRHIDNVMKYGPDSWQIQIWSAPSVFPPVIDYPEDYLPDTLPQTDLILSFGEQKGIAELLPEIAEMTGAQAVLAPIDNEAWLPRGLARQLHGWLARQGVACATPKPLCSLTETDYAVARRKRETYENPLIGAFARHFGQPELRVSIDPKTRLIQAVDVDRDAVCGCARFVAQGLIGLSADVAEEKSGLLHHHYPCLASMGIDTDYGDTLMHISGNLLKDNVSAQVKPFKRVNYLQPGNRSEPSAGEAEE